MNRIQGIAALAVAAATAGPLDAGELEIEVRGIRSDAGRIYVSVHAEVENAVFPDAAGMVAGGWRLAREGRQRLLIRDLPPGRYAVNAFHDENGNGDLDANILGIPTEGYGFANDAAGFMGPPDFASASVAVSDEPGVANITLAY